jgi:hypothetical protein
MRMAIPNMKSLRAFSFVLIVVLAATFASATSITQTLVGTTGNTAPNGEPTMFYIWHTSTGQTIFEMCTDLLDNVVAWDFRNPGTFEGENPTLVDNQLAIAELAAPNGNFNGQLLFLGDFQNQVAFASPTPEPGTLLTLGTGLVGLAGLARKRLFS